MDIRRAGAQPSGKGLSDWFTGIVRVDPLFEAPEPARVRGATVTFEPGARTAWHTHPLGQTLIVTSGLGRVQRWCGPIEEIRPGDVVCFEPSEKHWHGASPATAMTHIAIQEALEGDAWICGRTTMQQHFAEDEPFVSVSNRPAGPQPVHVARQAKSYAISVDTTGKLGWTAAISTAITSSVS